MGPKQTYLQSKQQDNFLNSSLLTHKSILELTQTEHCKQAGTFLTSWKKAREETESAWASKLCSKYLPETEEGWFTVSVLNWVSHSLGPDQHMLGRRAKDASFSLVCRSQYFYSWNYSTFFCKQSMLKHSLHSCMVATICILSIIPAQHFAWGWNIHVHRSESYKARSCVFRHAALSSKKWKSRASQFSYGEGRRNQDKTGTWQQ